jgi:hypothetical protein
MEANLIKYEKPHNDFIAKCHATLGGAYQQVVKAQAAL